MEQIIQESLYNIPPRTPTLSTLSLWSAQHIRDVFEAKTDADCLRAIDSTFSKHIAVTLNGSPMSREGIKNLVLTMRISSPTGLTVHWEQAAESARDPYTNRDGTFRGFYIIRGIKKQLPGMSRPVDFERHKSVSVKIASELSDPHIDSRRIIQLDFVARDVRVERQVSL